MKHKSIYMIADAIFSLAERKGATREQIWEYISSKKQYQDSITTKKMFYVVLRRLSQDNEFFHKVDGNHQRFRLSAKFKNKLAKLVNDGEELHLSLKQAMTTKVKEQPKKPAKKLQKVQMSKSKKGQQKLTKKNEKKMKETKIRNVSRSAKDTKKNQQKEDSKAVS